MLSVRTHKLRLWFFCNLQYYYRSEILCRYFSKNLPKFLNQKARNSNSQMFQKWKSVGVLQNRCSSNFCEILRKAHMSKSLFKNALDLLAWNFKLKTASGIILIFFSEFCKNVKNSFLQDSFRRLLLIFRKPDIQPFISKQICSLDHYCRWAIFDK